MPVFATSPALPSAHRRSSHRMCAEYPVGYVNVVNVLLDYVIAGQPGEVQPVADLPFGVCPPCLTRAIPESALVPEHLSANYVNYCAVVNSPDGFQVLCLVSPLRSNHDCQVPLPRALVRVEHRADTCCVHCNGLLGEQVLACRNRRSNVNRPE